VFGFSQLWLALFSFPFVVVIHQIWGRWPPRGFDKEIGIVDIITAAKNHRKPQQKIAANKYRERQRLPRRQ